MTSELHRVWHPFTQTKTAPPPLKVLRGSGSRLELEDGRHLIDMISSWWVNLHGHGHPEIAEAIYRQALNLEQVIFAGFTHEPAEEFAKELLAAGNGESAICDDTLISQAVCSEGAAIMPAVEAIDVSRTSPVAFADLSGCATRATGFQHVFYSDNGSTAVEVALKMAFQYWRNRGRNEKSGFVCFEGGYHGDTVGAMSVGGSSPFWGPFKSLMFSVQTVPFAHTFENDPDVSGKEEAALTRLRNVLQLDGDRLAAIIIEPLIQGAGGMRMCRSQFLARLRDLACEFDVLLIFDEVMTGFGRTGDWFASSKAQVYPDILCLSKGITGGFLPLSATLCGAHIYDEFLSEDWAKMLLHGHSYTANPLSLAAARMSLKLLRQNRRGFIDMEARHRHLSERYLVGHPQLVRYRHCGTVFAVDVDSSNHGYFNEIGPRLREEFLRQGLLIRPLGNTIYLLPPYCVTDDELELAFRAIPDCVERASSDRCNGSGELVPSS